MKLAATQPCTDAQARQTSHSRSRIRARIPATQLVSTHPEACLEQGLPCPPTCQETAAKCVAAARGVHSLHARHAGNVPGLARGRAAQQGAAV
jgi:hypothetical protein